MNDIKYPFGVFDESEIADYVVANNKISNDQQFSIVLLQLPCDEDAYSFSAEEVMELYRKYEDGQLNDREMSYHLVLLEELINKELDNLKDTPLDIAKKVFLLEISNYYLDTILPESFMMWPKGLFEPVLSGKYAKVKRNGPSNKRIFFTEGQEVVFDNDLSNKSMRVTYLSEGEVIAVADPINAPSFIGKLTLYPLWNDSELILEHLFKFIEEFCETYEWHDDFKESADKKQFIQKLIDTGIIECIDRTIN